MACQREYANKTRLRLIYRCPVIAPSAASRESESKHICRDDEYALDRMEGDSSPDAQCIAVGHRTPISAL